MKLVAQQRKIAMFCSLLLMIPAANVLTPLGLPFLEPVLAILGNLLLSVFILLLSFRA
jgi:Cu+-exporting ATPase